MIGVTLTEVEPGEVVSPLDDRFAGLMKRIVSPAIYNGKEIRDYGVDELTGHIYSFKHGMLRRLKPRFNQDGYLVVNLSDKKLFEGLYNGVCTIAVHILVQETLVPLPIPPDVTEAEWDRTPKSVKKLFREVWMVNHKDHEKDNFHPSNLEWVFGNSENARKYQEHRKKKA